MLNPLSANVVHARHDSDVAGSGCSASHRQNYQYRSVYLKEEKICFKIVSLLFAFTLSQSSEIVL